MTLLCRVTNAYIATIPLSVTLQAVSAWINWKFIQLFIS